MKLLIFHAALFATLAIGAPTPTGLDTLSGREMRRGGPLPPIYEEDVYKKRSGPLPPIYEEDVYKKRSGPLPPIYEEDVYKRAEALPPIYEEDVYKP